MENTDWITDAEAAELAALIISGDNAFEADGDQIAAGVIKIIDILAYRDPGSRDGNAIVLSRALFARTKACDGATDSFAMAAGATFGRNGRTAENAD